MANRNIELYFFHLKKAGFDRILFMRRFDELEKLSEILFDSSLISVIQKRYERMVFETIFTLKHQFLGYCILNNKEPKFKDSKNKKLAEKYLDRFIDQNRDNIIPDFSVFDDLLFVHKINFFAI